MMELFLVAFLLLLSYATTPNLAISNHETKRSRIIMRMIHYDSFKSPFYDPKLTLKERVAKMNQRSEARISDLMVVENNLEKYAVHDVQIYPFNSAQFLIPVKLGTPPVSQILIMDTGSLLLWVHCGFDTVGGELSAAPLYQHAQSSSYAEDVYCDTPICEYCILRGRCGRKSNRCEYFYNYVSGKTRGHLATEVVTFDSINGTEETIKRVVFGCSMWSTGSDRASGILGLGQRAVSLVSQQSYTGFSYCIGDITDADSESNSLILGEKPIMEGDSTPMFLVIGKYFITLERISVGDTFLDIDLSIFKRVDDKGGMLVDSGATISYLPEIAYNKLKEEIKSVIGTTLEEFISNHAGELCYYGIVTRDLQDFPTIAFHFAENADMELTPQNLFHQSGDDYFCLSVRTSEEKEIPYSILGVWAQQFFYISFDFNTMRMSFTRIDCDSLLD